MCVCARAQSCACGTTWAPTSHSRLQSCCGPVDLPKSWIHYSKPHPTPSHFHTPFFFSIVGCIGQQLHSTQVSYSVFLKSIHCLCAAGIPQHFGPSTLMGKGTALAYLTYKPCLMPFNSSIHPSVVCIPFGCSAGTRSCSFLKSMESCHWLNWEQRLAVDSFVYLLL